jgi:hypothetical protein
MNDKYISRKNLLDNSNIITVQTKEYGSIEVIPVDTIADIELADVQPVVYAHKTINVGRRSYCSNCGKLAIMEDFCSKCGAKVKDGGTECQ